MKEINSAAFPQEVLQSELPVLVDFFAEWCGPCRMLSPVMQELSVKYEGKVKFVKLNVDHAPELANSFGINSIPALLYFRNGQVKGSSVGFTRKEDLERKLSAWGKA
ncbi:MAG: thioredoxin [Oscillospiraceae bacterium]|nr:thioredoxin [Oscillospiraceae bacterium]